MIIEKRIKKFFEENAILKMPEIVKSSMAIFVLRSDGIILYNKKINLEHSYENQSVGVLISGLCHASEALTGLVGKNKESIDNLFRISVDTSSKGIHILPLETEDESYFLSTIYYDEVNPGKLKNYLKKVAVLLTKDLDEYNKEVVQKSSTEDFLFSNISDEEMDKLFLFAGN